MEFGARIRAARKGANLTQEGLAKRVGVTQGSVYQWEKDISSPSVAKLADVALATGVSFDWLATGRESVNEVPAEYRISPDHRRLIELFGKLGKKKQRALLELLGDD